MVSLVSRHLFRANPRIRSSQEEPGAARRSQEQPGGGGNSQKEAGTARSSQEKPGGVTSEEPHNGFFGCGNQKSFSRCAVCVLAEGLSRKRVLQILSHSMALLQVIFIVAISSCCKLATSCRIAEMCAHCLSRAGRGVAAGNAIFLGGKGIFFNVHVCLSRSWLKCFGTLWYSPACLKV